MPEHALAFGFVGGFFAFLLIWGAIRAIFQ